MLLLKSTCIHLALWSQEHVYKSKCLSRPLPTSQVQTKAGEVQTAEQALMELRQAHLDLRTPTRKESTSFWGALKGRKHRKKPIEIIEQFFIKSFEPFVWEEETRGGAMIASFMTFENPSIRQKATALRRATRAVAQRGGGPPPPTQEASPAPDEAVMFGAFVSCPKSF